MSMGPLAMLLGIFGVPLALLWLGHRLRRRSPRERGIFWGALLGHLSALVTATLASVLPPHMWGPEDLVRGLASYGALLLLPVLGGVIGAIAAPGGEQDEA